MRLNITRERNRKLNRSGTRPCDVCSTKTILVEHHIRGRSIPNPQHPSNLANLCSNCHMNTHSGVIIIEKWVMGTMGKFLAWHKINESGLTGEDSTPHQIGGKNGQR